MAGVFCVQCSRPNPAGARFCSNCGAPLVRAAAGTQGFAGQQGYAGQGYADQGYSGQPGGAPGGTDGRGFPGSAGGFGGLPVTGPATGGFGAINETTSMILPTVGETDLGELDAPQVDLGSMDSLPPGTGLLVVVRGPNAGSRFLLDDDFTSTGRHPDSDIFLDDVTVSRRHAEFYRQGDRFTVRDVGSLNGTYVNRERIEEAEIFGGDEVQIGKFRLLFLTRGSEVGRRRGPGAQDYA
jgi:hypothetical protein